MAWLNYVQDWSGVSAGLRVLASFYLDSANQHGHVRHYGDVGAVLRCAINSAISEDASLWRGFSCADTETGATFLEFENGSGRFTSL
jgi:hypothetical protein